MKTEDIKLAIRNLEQSEQRRLMMEVLPEILPKACTDEACLTVVRDFINEETSRLYREQHMGGI